MIEASITLGIQLTVGKVILDPGDIRGVGDWYNPSLCIPIKIQLYPTIKSEQFALIRLNASLHLAQSQDITNQLGLILTFGEQMSLCQNFQMVSLLQKPFQVEKK